MTPVPTRFTGPAAAPVRGRLSTLFTRFGPYASIFRGILAIRLIAKPARKRVLVEAILGPIQGAAAAKMPGVVFSPAPASEPDAETAIVDREVIGEFIGEVGAVAAAEILKTYLSETERRLTILRKLAVDQREAIHLEAHTLKGSSGIFGLPRLSGMARMLERNAASITAEEYPAALVELEAAYAESKVELAIYLGEAPAGVAPGG